MNKIAEPQTILSLLQRMRKQLNKAAKWSLLWDAADEFDNPIFIADAEIRRRSLQGALENLYVDERSAETMRLAAYGPVYYAVWGLLERAAVEIYGEDGTRLKEWAPGGYDRVSVAISCHGHEGLINILDMAIEWAEE